MRHTEPAGTADSRLEYRSIPIVGLVQGIFLLLSLLLDANNWHVNLQSISSSN